MAPSAQGSPWLKVMVGLYLLALEDAIKRDRAIDVALKEKESCGKASTTRTLSEESARILRRWEVDEDPNKNPPVVEIPMVIQNRERDAFDLLSTSSNIVLVAPIRESIGTKGIMRVELPYVWERYTPDPLEVIATSGTEMRSYKQIPIGSEFGPAIQAMRDQWGSAFSTPSHFSITGQSYGPQRNFPIHGPNNTLYDVLGDLQAILPTAHLGPGVIEVFCDLNTTLDITSTYGGKARHDGRFVLAGNIEVRITTLTELDCQQQVDKVEADYFALKRQEELMPDRIRVYGLFTYKHWIPNNSRTKYDTEFQKYRLATTSDEDWKAIPLRYLALVTTPLGRPLPYHKKGLKQAEMQVKHKPHLIPELTNPFSDDAVQLLIGIHSRSNSLHQNISPESIRVLDNGKFIITGWRADANTSSTHATLSDAQQEEQKSLLRILCKHSLEVAEGKKAKIEQKGEEGT
ncbi:hypothetical protein BDN72DRAFT_903353 [Pluteus cervinus]|uniref:Uncharacterized protein n=1 Tax=Pluteus cervinus TaxID=181527 RepID=A0ACD3A8V0_9AGAR|nr:hypothetical protein BDN72DRAFT_903353 [Pluteus cervinus]